jgi:hypothetical protein
VHGIGVFAVRAIPKGIDPFEIGIRYPRRWISISRAEFEAAAEGVRTLLRSLFIPDEKGRFSVPALGPNMVDIGVYLNHSSRPNMRTRDGYTFVTKLRIAAGEELTIDYRTFGAEMLLRDERAGAKRP